MAEGFKKGGKFHPISRKSTSALSSSDLKGTTGFNVKLKKKEVIQNPKHVTLSSVIDGRQLTYRQECVPTI